MRKGESIKEKNELRDFTKSFKRKRVKGLRELKVRNTVVPNIKAKLWATRLCDEMEGRDIGINLPEQMSNVLKDEKKKDGENEGEEIEGEDHVGIGETDQKEKIPPIQKERGEKYVICGTDVEALFPSLEDIECARMVKQAVMNSKIEFDNIDYKMALKYLKICGGEDYMRQVGLGNVTPKWKGKNGACLTVTGEGGHDEKMWREVSRELHDWEKKIIVARVIETAVIVSMSTHLYTFDEKIYLQSSGGPIGMRATASLANVVMKVYDQTWRKLMEREKVVIDLFVRYVDDCRMFMTSLSEGWRWMDTNFVFSWKWREEDLQSGESDSERTTRQITRAMCSLVPFLRFTGEECGMFESKTLPTLDTQLWCEGEITKFLFFEKPQVPNRVLMKGTALPEATIRSSLLQEVVRRMEHCSKDCPPNSRTEVLSACAQKMINSGHSLKSTRLTIVHGVTKYVENIKLDSFPENHKQHRPMYLYKKYNEGERQREKTSARVDWYGEKENGEKVKRKWRDSLKGSWRGANQLQRKIKSMPYTTVIQVPSSRGSRLQVKGCAADNKMLSIGALAKYVRRRLRKVRD